MIITRSPLRISIAGGGTDLPSYANKYGGFWISASINKYVYVTITRPFEEGIYLKYSKLEKVKKINKIEHLLIKEALRIMNFNTPQIEITTLADIPAGTGLGSSSSFLTALLKALYVYRKKSIDAKELANLACDIEINKLNAPIGVQDQYIAAYGGIRCFEYFVKDVDTYPLEISYETLMDLEDNLLLFFTGFSRSANSVLKEQDDKSKQLDSEMISNLNAIKDMAYVTKAYLEKGMVKNFADIMNIHWNRKKERSTKMSNPKIDEWYEYALSNGALGGKLVGAGGGGFLLFYANDKNKLRYAMTKCGLEEVRFQFDFEGTKCIL